MPPILREVIIDAFQCTFSAGYEQMNCKIIAVAATIWLASLGAAAAQAVQVENIRVQLFYENSGQLSDDLTKKKNLALWNTISGKEILVDLRQPFWPRSF